MTTTTTTQRAIRLIIRMGRRTETRRRFGVFGVLVLILRGPGNKQPAPTHSSKSTDSARRPRRHSFRRNKASKMGK